MLDALDALAGEGIGQVDVEFLRPATLQKLVDRLEQEPAIDILHFDGHGVFDAKGQLREKAKQGLPSRFADVKTEESSKAVTGAKTRAICCLRMSRATRR